MQRRIALRREPQHASEKLGTDEHEYAYEQAYETDTNCETLSEPCVRSGFLRLTTSPCCAPAV